MLPKSKPSLVALLSKNPQPNPFKIQLLSEKTIVLVEFPGNESELFIPQIVNNRITMQNIIPNRRCCCESSLTTHPIVIKGGAGCVVEPVSSTPLRALQWGNSSTPLAKSTPALSIRRISGGKKAQELTPEPARFLAVPFESEIQDTSPQLNLSCSGSSTTESPPALLPPELLSHTGSRMSMSGSSNSYVSPIPPLGNSVRKTPPERTYARRKHIVKSTPTPTWSPLQKKKRQTAASATKVPNPVMKLEVRNRKLIVDANKSIAAYKLKTVISTPVVKKRIIQKQVTAKTRRQFEALKGTAFDLLTTSAQGNMAIELVKQFQNACMDKRATTVPNYAELAASSRLEMDHEVKGLLAKQKRLEQTSKGKPRPWMKLT